jgi:hypothetical protein
MADDLVKCPTCGFEIISGPRSQELNLAEMMLTCKRWQEAAANQFQCPDLEAALAAQSQRRR